MQQRFIFFFLALVVFILLDFYVFASFKQRLKKWGQVKSEVFRFLYWSWAILIYVFCVLSIFIKFPIWLNAIFVTCLSFTYISKLVYVFFLILDDIRRVFIWLKRKLSNSSKGLQDTVAEELISRSEFLLRAGTVMASVPLVSLSFGLVAGAYDYRIKHRVLYLKNLPKAFDGIKIGQISDIHSGSFYRKNAVLRGVEMLMKEKAEIIFFTGDLVNNKATEMRDYQDLFARVKAPMGVYSTLGNHDYGDYSTWVSAEAKRKNLQDLMQTHKNMGWQLLMNEHKRIRIDNEEIAILGIENWGTGRFPKYGKMDLAVKNTEDVPLKLLLSHDPSHWRAQVLKEYPQIDMMFSGHTHGMQMGVQIGEFQMSPSRLIYKEWAGLYQEGAQQLYVNVGFGFLGLPGRVGILPEITIFELKQA